MIKGLRDGTTERIWFGEGDHRLPPEVQKVARRKLRMLNNARSLDDLRIPPANRLEALRGNRSGEDCRACEGPGVPGLRARSGLHYRRPGRQGARRL